MDHQGGQCQAGNDQLLKKKGFNIEPCEKWQGSVEDGIGFIRKFEEVVIHERCKHTYEEFRLYSWKVDKQTGKVMPVVVDAHNHCIDPIRYGLADRIKLESHAGFTECLG